MQRIDQLISLIPKDAITTGINRISYCPYNMEMALAVVNKIAQVIIPNFKMTEKQRVLFIQLIKYFHGDPSFEGDINKGILILGPTGSGKSMTMEIMSKYRQIDNTKTFFNGKAKSMHFDIVRSTKMASDFASSGYAGIEPYIRRFAICIDDIGFEPDDANNFGNKTDVIGQILTERYERRHLTFGTTNKTVERLGERYDDRIISRMHMLFNFLYLNDIDFRK